MRKLEKTNKPPSRPPQPKSEGVEGLLIDFEENTPIGSRSANSTPRPSRAADNRSQALAMLDSSLGERYQFLPAPLGEESEDPFIVKPTVAQLLNTSFDSSAFTPMTSSMYSKQKTPLTAATVFSSSTAPHRAVSQPNLSLLQGQLAQVIQTAQASAQSNAQPQSYSSQQSSVSSNPGYYRNTSEMQNGTSAYGSTYYSSTSQAPSVCGSQYSDFSSSEWDDISTRYGSVCGDQYSAVNRINSPSSDAPVLPPRIYANVPGDSHGKPLPPLPPHAQGQSQQVTQLSSQVSQIPSQIPQASVSPSHSRCYANTPSQNSPQNGSSRSNYFKLSNPAPGQYYGNVNYVTSVSPTNVPNVNLCSTDTEKDAKVDKAFGWLNDAMSGLTLEKSDNTSQQNQTQEKDKRALVGWELKSMMAKSLSESYSDATSNRTGSHSQSYDDSHMRKTRPKLTKGKSVDQALPPSGAGPSVDDYKGPMTVKLPPAPALPPRDKPRYGKVRATSSIHPIVKDGQQMSKTHYWLIPDKQKGHSDPPTAQVRPYNSHDDTRGHYQNINQINPGVYNAANVDATQVCACNVVTFLSVTYTSYLLW